MPLSTAWRLGLKSGGYVIFIELSTGGAEFRPIKRGCQLRQPHNLFSPNLRCTQFADHVTQQLNSRFFQSEATLLGAVRGYLGKNFL